MGNCLLAPPRDVTLHPDRLFILRTRRCTLNKASGPLGPSGTLLPLPQAVQRCCLAPPGAPMTVGGQAQLGWA